MRKRGLKSCYPRIYKIWQGMRQRCNNPNDKDYANYGGRGIRVCEEWDNSSKEFVKWALANGYDATLTIDRIDCDGDYRPDNCRWATMTQQQRNKHVGRNNGLGVKGVHMDRGQYRAVIYVGNKRIDLGRHKTLGDAIAARRNGEIKYWGVTA